VPERHPSASLGPHLLSMSGQASVRCVVFWLTEVAFSTSLWPQVSVICNDLVRNRAGCRQP